VSSYRVFVAIVFAIVAITVGWSDQNLPPAAAVIVGPAAVTVWVLTLLGALGIGPVAAIRNAMCK
jgi:amino acid transporter